LSRATKPQQRLLRILLRLRNGPRYFQEPSGPPPSLAQRGHLRIQPPGEQRIHPSQNGDCFALGVASIDVTKGVKQWRWQQQLLSYQ
ncbi:hypothetical protein U1Q18_046795, partial [Sarracenia purpurea var. burkii]